MRTKVPLGDLVFISHIAQDLASGGGVYSRAIIDLLRSVWATGSVRFAGPKTSTNPSRLTCIGWALLTRQPSKAVFAARSGLSNALEQITIGQHSTICLNSPDALPLIERIHPEAKFILVCHNIESDLFRQQVSRLPAMTRPLFSSDIKRYTELEDRAFRKASLVIAISDCDSETIQKKQLAAKVLHIPPIFERKKRSTRPITRDGNLRLGFVGRMNWWPNRDAVAWMQRNLTPVPEGREIHLYGLGSDARTDPQRGVTGHGFVEDDDALWNDIDVALCPMHSGGDVNIKLVEALTRGVPVIATSFGARGLGIELSDRPGLRILDGEAAWRAFIASDQIIGFAREAPDPALATQFRAETHVKRLSAALYDAALLP